MKTALMVTLFGATLAVAATAVPHVHALTPTLLQEHEHDRDDDRRTRTDEQANPNYYNNRYYRLGNSEGYTDYRRHHQRATHRHKYDTDDDRRAHDYGYHQGWQGRRWSDHDRDDRH